MIYDHSWVDGGANMETSPLRSQLPVAHSTIISAPITINSEIELMLDVGHDIVP